MNKFVGFCFVLLSLKARLSLAETCSSYSGEQTCTWGCCDPGYDPCCEAPVWIYSVSGLVGAFIIILCLVCCCVFVCKGWKPFKKGAGTRPMAGQTSITTVSQPGGNQPGYIGNNYYGGFGAQPPAYGSSAAPPPPYSQHGAYSSHPPPNVPEDAAFPPSSFK